MDLFQASPERPTLGTLPCLGLVGLLIGLGLLVPPPGHAQQPETRIEFLKYGSMAQHVAQSPDGTHIAIGARDANGGSRVVLWNRTTQERVWTEPFSANRAPDVAFDSTGTRVYVSTSRRRLTIRNLDDHSTAVQETEARVSEVELVDGQLLGADIQAGGAQGGETLQIWKDGQDVEVTRLNTDAPVRTLTFRRTAPVVVFSSAETEVTFWNYQTNSTRTIDMETVCGGRVTEIKSPTASSNVYLITAAYAECNPDHLCIFNTATGSLTQKYRRKNISHIEPMGDGNIAYSRGNHVYTLNTQTGEEKIVYDSDNAVNDLSYHSSTLVIANSDAVLLEL